MVRFASVSSLPPARSTPPTRVELLNGGEDENGGEDPLEELGMTLPPIR
jgi:hypothetical protein